MKQKAINKIDCVNTQLKMSFSCPVSYVGKLNEILPISSHFCPLTFTPPSLTTDLSKGAMSEFQEQMRQQLESSMHKELEKLGATTKGAEAEVG